MSPLADPMAKNAKGQTVLHTAAAGGYQEFCLNLIRVGNGPTQQPFGLDCACRLMSVR